MISPSIFLDDYFLPYNPSLCGLTDLTSCDMQPEATEEKKKGFIFTSNSKVKKQNRNIQSAVNET